MRINEYFLQLPGSYLFAEIDRRVKAYSMECPDRELIRLGIGDVTLPLVPAVIEAMHMAVDEMGRRRPSRAIHPTADMIFCFRPFWNTTTAPEGWNSLWKNSLSPTEPKVIAAVLEISWARTI